jgi:hypothetical protein
MKRTRLRECVKAPPLQDQSQTRVAVDVRRAKRGSAAPGLGRLVLFKHRPSITFPVALTNRRDSRQIVQFH